MKKISLLLTMLLFSVVARASLPPYVDEEFYDSRPLQALVSCGGFTQVFASGKFGADTVTTDGNDSTGGTLGIIMAAGPTGNSGTITVSSSPANTWIAGPPIPTGVAGISNQMWYCTNLITSASANFTATASTITLSEIDIYVYVFSSAGTPFFAGQTGANATTGMTLQPGALTPSGTNLFVTAFSYDARSTVVNPTCTFPFADNAGIGLLAAWTNSAATQNPTWTISSALDMASTMMMFGVTGCSSGGGGGLFPSDSIVLDWRFNGDANDASANANNGTTHGTTSFVTDEIGRATHAINLDGSTAYVDAASPSVANFTSGDFTIVTFLTNNAADFTGNPVLWGNGTFGVQGYYFQLHNASGGDNFASRPLFGFHDGIGSGDHQIVTTDRAVSITSNTCIVFVRNGTSGKIYVNGTDVTDVSQPTIGTITSNTLLNFTLGKYLGGGDLFKGNVQELIIYSRALTGTEITPGSGGTSQ